MPGTPGTRSGSGILLPYSSFQYQADGEWRNANQQLLQQPAHPIYITNYLAVGKNNGEWKRVTHRPPVPTSGILLIILASSLKAMQWRNWITPCPGWARGNGILNTWLPASTLFQWRWTELRISCLAGRPAPTILLTIWLQAWAMGNGKVARGSPARFRAPGAWYRYIWV